MGRGSLHEGGPRRRPIRLRITVLLLVPLLSLVALWGFTANVTLGSALNKYAVSTTYDKIGVPGSMMSMQLQLERALSAAAADGSPQARAQLAAQRARTDAAIGAFRKSALTARVEDSADKLIKQRLGELTRALELLGGLRSSVEGQTADRLRVIDGYSGIIDGTMRLFGSLTVVNDLEIYRSGRALIGIGWGRDYMMRQDALVTTALAARGRISAPERAALARWSAAGRQEFDGGYWDLSGPMRTSMSRFVDSPDFRRYRAMEDAILASTGARLPAEVADWPRFGRQVSGAWGLAVNQAGADLARQAEPIGDRIVFQLAVAGGLGLIAVLVSILLSVLFGRSLSRELRELQRAAQQLAGERLPAVIARLRRGEEVDVHTEAPPLRAGRTTEVARVADAFTQVQRTAIESAVGESQLRRGINRVFLNLAWRSQSLLHRQLRMLDGMERRTGDPEVLEDLFRLDHLTTRMRRHAEGLAILSGAAPGREWSKPAPLEDVLRAAVAEVEDYARVEVDTSCDTPLSGCAIAGVVHLVAELIENATIFSPPNTEVTVRGELVGNGYAIEIIDRGIGIPPHDRSELNARLAHAPEFDLVDSNRLGLFVVARLAARHGIQVTLQESPYRGTSAIVVLPHDLVVRQLEAAPPEQEQQWPASNGAAPEDLTWFGPSAAIADGDGYDRLTPAEDGLPKPELPRRQRQASLVPQLRAVSDEPEPAAEAPEQDRSPEETRDLMDTLQAGWQRGRENGDDNDGGRA